MAYIEAEEQRHVAEGGGDNPLAGEKGEEMVS